MIDPTDVLDGIVHAPTQAERPGFDLTVKTIHRFTAPGRVDFGGGELERAGTEPHPTQKRHPDDDYAWWTLDPGLYRLEYNESVTADDVVLTVQPRRELLDNAAYHPTLHVTTLSPVPLAVGDPGIRIKENARISTVIDVARTPS